jgi:hypothetical protein
MTMATARNMLHGGEDERMCRTVPECNAQPAAKADEVQSSDEASAVQRLTNTAASSQY